MKIKKILSLLVVLTLVCSFMTMTNVQAAEDEFAILKTLGINTDFSDNTTPITRYQLAVMALDLTGQSSSGDGEPIYPDVPVKHKYFPVINAVTESGLMGAIADGSFAPDSNASVMDGGRILLSELGYTAFAEQAGWTDSQYNSKVQSLGLMAGIDTSKGLTAYGFGKMIINMLSKKTMEIVSVNSDGIEFKESNYSYVESKYGYKLRYGIMQANGNVSIASAVPVTTKQAVIDGILYRTDGRDFTDYVGYNVKYIVTSEFEDGRVIHVEKYKGHEELVIDAEDILSYSNRTLTYTDEDDSIETVIVPLSARLILNGTNVSSLSDVYFKPEIGNIVFVDTEGDSVYDVVKITSKIYIKVGGASTTSISDAWTGEAYDLRDRTVYIYKNGSAYDVSQITTGSYLELTASNFAYATVEGNEILQPDAAASEVLSFNMIDDITTVTGKINSRRGNGVAIDGNFYEFSSYYYDLIKSDYVDSVVLGATATLVLNNRGQIIDIVDIQSEYSNSSVPKKYGYMTNITEARGLEGQAMVRLVDIETLEEIGYETAKDCKLNGAKFKYSDSFAHSYGAGTNTAFYLPDGNFKHQLIRYALNEEGKISELYLAVDRAHKYVTKHILPLSADDFNPDTTTGEYNQFDLTNGDYDPKYDGYDDNNFTLDKNGYLSGSVRFEGLYSLEKSTVQLEIPVNYAIDDAGVSLGATDTGHYDAYANLQEVRYWRVSKGEEVNSTTSLINNSHYQNVQYVQFYDVSERYVPTVAIRYVKKPPVTDELVLEGVRMGDAMYNVNSRYWYVTDVNTVYDDKTEKEKTQVSAVATVGTRLETATFIEASNIKENTTSGQLVQRRVSTGYTFELDEQYYSSGSNSDYWIDFNHADDKANYLAEWKDIKKGDLIEVRLDTMGMVNGFRRVVDGDIIKDYDNLECGYVAGLSRGGGNIAVNLGYCVKSFGLDGALVNLAGPDASITKLAMIFTQEYKPGGNNSIKGCAMIINLKSGQCEVATLEDVKVGDYVLYRMNCGEPAEVFILRP